MQGINHIISNTCSAVLVGEGIFALNDFLEHFTGNNLPFYNNLRYVCIHTIDFLVPHTESTVFLCLWWTVAAFLFYLGSLLPDCDTKKSIIGRKLYIPVEHRTWTHTLWFPLSIFAVSLFAPVLFYLSAGYILHLFWDNLSVGGVCFLYPLSKYRHYGNNGAKMKKHHVIKLYRTGKVSEGVVIGILIAITLISLIYMFIKLFVK